MFVDSAASATDPTEPTGQPRFDAEQRAQSTTAPTPREFMEPVVAWPGDEPGDVNIHAPRADRRRPDGDAIWYGCPFRDLDELLNYSQYCASNPGKFLGVYFCTSTQQTADNKGNFLKAVRN